MGLVRSAFRSLAVTASGFAVLLAAACGGNDGPSAPSGPTANGMAIVAGNYQLAKYGTAVPIAPSVKLTNANGPVAGAQVVFAAAAGSGSVTGGTVTTDANGVATVGSWILSPVPGINTLKVTSGTLTISISATAVPGAPAAIVAKSGNGQNGVERGQLPVPLQIEVTDGTYPIRGVQVDFAVTAGGGSVGRTQSGNQHRWLGDGVRVEARFDWPKHRDGDSARHRAHHDVHGECGSVAGLRASTIVDGATTRPDSSATSLRTRPRCRFSINSATRPKAWS